MHVRMGEVEVEGGVGVFKRDCTTYPIDHRARSTRRANLILRRLSCSQDLSTLMEVHSNPSSPQSGLIESVLVGKVPSTGSQHFSSMSSR